MKAHRVIVLLLILSLVASGTGVYASYSEVHASQDAQAREQQAAQRAGKVIERKLCTTLGSLAALTPPRGNARANPSRAYEQALHSTLDQLGPDLGCRKRR